MTLTRSHKIRLLPNKEQEQWLKMVGGSARYAYNQMLDKAISDYENFKKNGDKKPSTSFYSIRKTFRDNRDVLMPWWKEVPERAYSNEAAHLSRGFSNFYQRLKTGGAPGFPKFKRRGNDSFTLDRFTLNDDTTITLQGHKIRLAEKFRFDSTDFHVGCTVSTRAGKWYVSITCEVPEEKPRKKNRGTVGIDLNLAEYVTSDGERFEVPKSYRKSQRKLRHAQKDVSRKKNGSKNRDKALLKLQKVHEQVSNQRLDWLHKMSAYFTDEYNEIHLEDLNVSGMKKNAKLALGVSDAGFSEFRRQITYKAEAQQSNLILVDRWFPSSKMCGKCGVKNEKLLLSQRSWTCGSCGKRLDRDLNAARNIMEYSEEKWMNSSDTSEYFHKIHHTGGSSEIHACGEAEVDASMKQEPTLNARMSINGHD